MRKIIVALLLISGPALAQIGPGPSSGGTPGGSDTQVQYNKAAAFAGNSNLLYYDTALPTPGSGPSVVQVGATSSGTIGYFYVPVGQLGYGLSSPVTTVTSSQTTGLNGTNYNAVTTAAVTGAASCDVYRIQNVTQLGYQTYLANIPCGNTYNDQSWSYNFTSGPSGSSIYPQVDNSAGILVDQNLEVAGNLAVGGAVLGANYQGTAGRGLLNVAQTNSGAGSETSVPDTSNITSYLNLTPAGYQYISDGWGIQSFVNIPPSNTQPLQSVSAFAAQLTLDGSGPTSSNGLYAETVEKGSATNTSTTQSAAYLEVSNQGTGTLGTVHGVYSDLFLASGTTTLGVDYDTAGGCSSGATCTTWIDFRANKPTGTGAITTLTGVQIADLSGFTGTTTNYGLDSQGTAQKNRIQGQLQLGALMASGTKFTASGSGASPVAGGATAGTFTTTTTGAMNVTVTMGNSQTAPTGWACAVSDETTANLMQETASTTTTVTFGGTSVSGDTIVFGPCTEF